MKSGKKTRMKSVAMSQIGDGKTPNKYWVSVSDDYYLHDPKENTMIWQSESAGREAKGKTLRVFKTYEEAKRFADGIELDSKKDGINVSTVSIEDRLSGQVHERTYNSTTEDLKFTMEQERKLGVPSSIRAGKVDAQHAEELYRLYGGSIPSYLNIINKDKIKIRAEQWEGAGAKEITITPKDVVDYYHTEARNITSGVRSLAGFAGDWRMVDGMAKEALEVFKILNKPALDREAKKRGMELKA